MRKFIAIVCSLVLSGCSTAGNGKFVGEISAEEVRVEIQLGANVKEGLDLDIDMARDESGASHIKITGAGKGEINREPGHEATVEIVREGGKIMSEGVRRGFAP